MMVHFLVTISGIVGLLCCPYYSHLPCTVYSCPNGFATVFSWISLILSCEQFQAPRTISRPMWRNVDDLKAKLILIKVDLFGSDVA